MDTDPARQLHRIPMQDLHARHHIERLVVIQPRQLVMVEAQGAKDADGNERDDQRQDRPATTL